MSESHLLSTNYEPGTVFVQRYIEKQALRGRSNAGTYAGRSKKVHICVKWEGWQWLGLLREIQLIENIRIWFKIFEYFMAFSNQNARMTLLLLMFCFFFCEILNSGHHTSSLRTDRNWTSVISISGKCIVTTSLPAFLDFPYKCPNKLHMRSQWRKVSRHGRRGCKCRHP